jgi:sialate O-acetylesterase
MKKYLFSILSICLAVAAMADVRLPQIFSTNMVLQRNIAIPVWGWAAPGEKVTVQFNKQTKSTRAGKDGKWKVQLSQEAAGGPFQLVVKGKNSITVDNVLVGEVWLCSGQSNMEMNVKHSEDKRYQKDIRAANDPQIRHIKIKNIVSDTPSQDIEGDWKIADDSNNVADFSSVGYFFAKKLQEELHVPIGLINSSWGGTVVETWISRDSLDKSDEFKGSVTKTYAEIKSAKSDGKVWPNDYPSLLFNGMINPVIPYAIKGALWYQGESNADRASQYSKSFPMMIRDWRARWKEGDFPFYFVQLASWNANNGNSVKGSEWAELRESQTSTLSLPNTGMAVTLDIGDTKNIHPSDKKDVGLRLAAIALNKLYDQQGEYSGPVYESMSVDGNKATLTFTHADGLWIKDNYQYLKGFEAAGADQKFHYAKAEIKDGKVIVYSDSVAAPVAVHYGWADDMPEANLYNKDGFPAQPFRTDKWKGVTDDKKYMIR